MGTTSTTETAEGGALSRPRGRPQRLPVDANPPDSPTIDATRRAAWLLATTRLLAPATADRGRKAFIDDVRAHDVAADAARISRWESGAQSPPTALVSAYEVVTGQPRGALHAAETLLRRTARGGGATQRESRERTGAERAHALDEGFDRIDAGRADGADWLRLVADLATYPDFYLPPASWRFLCDRLVSELTRSTGIAHLRRHEAATALMAHPRGRHHFALSIGRFVTDPDVQHVAPATSLLREIDDAEATDLVLRLMTADHKLLRRSGGLIAGSMVGRSLFSVPQHHALEGYAARELTRGRSLAGRLHAAELACRLPEPAYERIVGVMRDPRSRARVVRARSTLEITSAANARTSAEAVATYAEAATGRHVHDPDQMLRRLVREALFHVHHDRRNLAATMLAVSPYARPVADAVRRLTEEDGLVAAMAWALLQRLGHVVDRATIGPMMLKQRPGAHQGLALVTLGLAHGPLPDDAAERAEHLATQGESWGVRHAALLCLGLAGHPFLERLAEGPADWPGNGARWWLRTGSLITDLPDTAG